MREADLRVFPTLEDASHALAAEIAQALREAVCERDRATLVLSGGGTPRRLHELLAAEPGGLPWARVHVLWGDERFVPPDSEDSNYGMARETLLDHVAIPPENVHPWLTGMRAPEAAALAMQVTLERLSGRSALVDGPPRFDVVLLGMGADGHTASLFPGSQALQERARWTIPSEAPDEPRERLTFTVPVLNAARAVHFLVSGASKREALQCVLSEQNQPDHPAALIAVSYTHLRAHET